MLSHRRIIIASVLGNALEFYNLTLCGIMAGIFADLYFPSTNHTLSLISSLGVFAVGFIVRPLGAILFGYIGDRWGRKKALSLSILGMGIPTLLIGLTPGYATIGIAAPLLIITCRLMQGLCAGGEFNGAIIFALEHLGKNRPGMTGGLIVGSCLIGSLVATGVAALCGMEGMPLWGWRFAFILGGVLSFFGLYIRLKLHESPVFQQAQTKDRLAAIPLKAALKNDWRSCLMVFSVGALDGALTYSMVGFLSIYLVHYLEVETVVAATGSYAASLACIFGCPLFGYAADKFGAREMIVLSALLVLGLIMPTFIALSAHSSLAIVGGHILLGLLVASVIGVQPLFSQNLFPPQDRYTGISFSYSMGIGVVGGLTPMILTALMDLKFHFLTPSFYIMGMTVAMLVIVLSMSHPRRRG